VASEEPGGRSPATPDTGENICVRESFFALKSGHSCDVYPNYSCGLRVDDQSARILACNNGVVVATDMFYVQDEAPREEMHWEDCTALAEGRGGETCDPSFACYKPGEPGCLEAVVCSDYMDELVHVDLCDDSLTEAPDKERPLVTDCEGTINARPLDPCKGEFLCKEGDVSTWRIPVPSCDSAEGYCNLKETDYRQLYWCDGEALHILDTLLIY